MHTADLIADHADLMDCSKAAAKRHLETYVAQIAAALIEGEKVALPGLGTLKPAERGARAGVDPDGKPYQVPPKRTVRLRVASALDEALNA
jgi:DNA-binding protein HU-beta